MALSTAIARCRLLEGLIAGGHLHAQTLKNAPGLPFPEPEEGKTEPGGSASQENVARDTGAPHQPPVHNLDAKGLGVMGALEVNPLSPGLDPLTSGK